MLIATSSGVRLIKEHLIAARNAEDVFVEPTCTQPTENDNIIPFKDNIALLQTSCHVCSVQAIRVAKYGYTA